MDSPLPRVLFRVDASSTIGMGHLSRDLTLAHALACRGVSVGFASIEPPEAAARRVEAFGFPLHRLSATGEDFAQTHAVARSTGSSMVMVDGYQFNSEYLRRFRETRLFACFFDDMINLRYACHAVFNQNFYAPPEKFDRPPDCDLILGPAHALVRDEFVEARGSSRSVVRNPRRVLVTMGGADPTEESFKVLEALTLLPREPQLDVHLVIGPTNAKSKEIRAAAKAVHGHTVEILENIGQMAQQMAWCDVALTASGTTCMELCCIGVPSLVTIVVDNQLLIGPELDRLGLMRSLGWHADVNARRIVGALAELLADFDGRKVMVEEQRAAIDGQGKHRAVTRLLASFEKHRAAGAVS